MFRIRLHEAVQTVASGGIIAYPTEAVFGLGCDPLRYEAVLRILEMKRRNVSAGLILIADHHEQLAGFIAPTDDEARRLAAPDEIVTWVVTAAPRVPDWITGKRRTIAVRITPHPVAAALCRLAGTALISTSANLHGGHPARSAREVRLRFGRRVDCIVPGHTGMLARPTEIRDARTGAVLRTG